MQPDTASDHLGFAVKVVGEAAPSPTTPTVINPYRDACTNYGTWSNSTGTGLLVVVTTDQVDRVEISNGEWIDLSLSDTVEGYRFAIVDLAAPDGPDWAAVPGSLRLFDGDGNQLSCGG